jgi:hypothetical protein
VDQSIIFSQELAFGYLHVVIVVAQYEVLPEDTRRAASVLVLEVITN